MIYLDHAATTRLCPEALNAMMPFLTGSFGNPSSSYEAAFTARDAVTRARRQVAELISARPETVFFTSGGSEADNWALRGTAQMLSHKGKHLITTEIEHHAVLHTADYLERMGFEVTRLPVNENGRIDPRQLQEAIRPDTILVSVMFANNEIGTIQPIRELADIAHAHQILFHTDAVQAFGQIPINVNALGIDMLSASAHKLYGPKGIGCLYLREGIKLPPLIYGGAQEGGMRAGTEPVASIAGFGAAAERARLDMEASIARETKLRDYLIEQIQTRIPCARLNGSPIHRLPGNANFSFPSIEGETLLILLDMKGICASAGSACSSASHTPSHVLKAIGLPDSLAKGSLRLTLGRETTKEELDQAIDGLEEILSGLLELSDPAASSRP